jgi:hypothetical protein
MIWCMCVRSGLDAGPAASSPCCHALQISVASIPSMHRMLACTSKCRLDSGMQDLGVIDDVSLPIWGREGHANDGADITPRLMEDDSGMSVGPGVFFSHCLLDSGRPLPLHTSLARPRRYVLLALSILDSKAICLACSATCSATITKVSMSHWHMEATMCTIFKM